MRKNQLPYNEERYNLHITTIASNLVLKGLSDDVKDTARKLNEDYNCEFLSCVVNSENTNDNKYKCLMLYAEKRFKSS